MDIEQAVRERHSVRKYRKESIPEDIVAKLNEEIEAVNRESGLSVRLALNEPDCFSGAVLRLTTGFRNADNYFAMIGPDDESLYEKSGYFGERLVLLAQQLGLNTCWAMLCKKGSCQVEKGQKMSIGISVGYGEDQGVPHKNKPVSKIADMEGAPDWFVKGVEFAMLAPTGMNKQGFRFERDGDKVRIIHGNSALSRIDAGIVKYHFELGAGKENFTWCD